ncbi:MAG: amidohydrolase [Bryobacterales bacterium]|nr:amidohydrolase [Bryobacterales bacterium]
MATTCVIWEQAGTGCRARSRTACDMLGIDMFPITDAYGHCGLRKFRPIADVRRITDRHGVARANLVQHMGEFDNQYLADIVGEEPERFSAVFLVDIEAPDAVLSIRKWASTGLFRGMRMTSASILTHPVLWQEAANLGLHLVVSGPFPAPEAAAISRFAASNAGNSLQLTHLGLPQHDESPAFPSLPPVLEMASQRNIHVQVSGMHQRAAAPYTALIPAIQQLWEAYGESRLVYGSNFPVMETDQVYELEIHLIRSGRLGIPATAAEAVMDANARRLWFQRNSLRAGSLVWRCAFS